MAPIPLDLPDLPPEDAYAAAALSADLGVVKRLETALAIHCGRRHAVACASGTAAAWAALAGLNPRPGDEVICSALVPDGTLLALAALNLKPVFVDVDPTRMVANPLAVEAAVSPRTRAMVAAVGAASQAGIEAVAAVARRLELPLLEDGGQAFGSMAAGRHLGSIGRASVFDFGPGAPMTTLHGGVLLTDDDRLADAARKTLAAPAACGHLPLGAPMSPFSAALGQSQLRRLPEILARRQALAECYLRHLLENPDLVLPDLHGQSAHAWPILWVRLSTDYRTSQQAGILHHLARHGIAAALALRCSHKLVLPWNNGKNKPPILPVAEALARRTLRLPMFNRLREDQVEQVCRTLTAAMLEARRHLEDWPEGGGVPLDDR